ncbi:peptidylprolyl isomerase [Streptomyces triticirhizae]|uniref:Peptidyl-prolyl cis-trans isomerase n=1 Tax=Streptomyces triticirhizae TaxID=2483353 RepID=A0A3M2LZA9_9ACTN|nr:peptidylprolyl isomerase [Streptomyces triticirhizae]RMI42617.1 peptidylprolyl isomerase [Streptomyces triticirhizae]
MSSKERRRRELARAKYERQARRRAERARRGRRVRVLLAVVAVLVVAGGGTAWAMWLNDDDSPSDAAASPSESPTDETPTDEPVEDPCDTPEEGEPTGDQWDEEPELTVDTGTPQVMTLATTCGDIELTLDPEAAPRTVNSFAFLAGEDYFDHTPCHRLTTEGIFVLQCGDPTGTGQGGPGYELPDENLDDPAVADGVYPTGTVAMANSGPDTGGSQFFLVYEDSQLPASYTPFGQVTGGLDVLETIAGAGSAPPDPTSGNTAPNATVVINEATVEPAA